MKRPRLTNQERMKILKRVEKSQFLDKRRRQLYNKKYRKSIFFISVWAGRVVFIVLFIIASVLHNKPYSTTKEIVVSKYTESYISRTKSGSFRMTDLHIETKFQNYLSKFKDKSPPDFNVGDTLLIERNIFTKPVYFTKSDWNSKYWIRFNFITYYIILFLTIVSLFFNDGLDRFTDKILLIIWSLNIIALVMYFFY